MNHRLEPSILKHQKVYLQVSQVLLLTLDQKAEEEAHWQISQVLLKLEEEEEAPQEWKSQHSIMEEVKLKSTGLDSWQKQAILYHPMQCKDGSLKMR